MSVKAEGVTPTARNAEIIVGFVPENVRAPFLLRCGALIVDYLLVIGFPVIFLLLGRWSGDDGANLLSGSWAASGWLTGALFAVTNVLILPIISGQSIGKIAAGIRVVDIKGFAATHREMLVRQTLGYLLTIFSFGLGFLLSALSSKGRSLHDYIAGTMVIYADRRRRSH